jgi:hypothetical protein
LFHILKTGYDCAVGRRIGDQRPSEIEVSTLAAVPGARVPAEKAYDAYQALLWIANRDPSVDKQEELLAAVLDLIQPLLQSSLH